MADKRIAVNVSLSPQAHERLMRESEERMVGVSRLVERAITQLFDRLPPVHHSLAPSQENPPSQETAPTP